MYNNCLSWLFKCSLQVHEGSNYHDYNRNDDDANKKWCSAYSHANSHIFLSFQRWNPAKILFSLVGDHNTFVLKLRVPELILQFKLVCAGSKGYHFSFDDN